MLLETAERGVKQYKKALSFCANKWDFKTDATIELGTTKEDVIEYVREKMYNLLVKSKVVDSESEEEIDG